MPKSLYRDFEIWDGNADVDGAVGGIRGWRLYPGVVFPFAGLVTGHLHATVSSDIWEACMSGGNLGQTLSVVCISLLACCVQSPGTHTIRTCFSHIALHWEKVKLFRFVDIALRPPRCANTTSTTSTTRVIKETVTLPTTVQSEIQGGRQMKP